MMRSFYKNFKRIDLIGPQIGVEHTNSTRFKSALGATISFIAVILITVIAFLFGREVYQRDKPKLSISQELLENSVVKIEDLNLTLLVTKFTGEVMYNPFDYVQIKASLFTIFNNSSYKNDDQSYIITNNNGIMSLANNKNLNFENDIYSIPSTTLRIHLRKCVILLKNCAFDFYLFFIIL